MVCGGRVLVSPLLLPGRHAAAGRVGAALAVGSGERVGAARGVGFGERTGAVRKVGLGRRVGAAQEEGLGGRDLRWVGGGHGASILCACGCRGFLFRNAELQKMMGQMGTGLWVSKKGRGWRRGMGKRVGEVGTKELEGSAGRLAKSEQRNWGLARARMGRGWCWVGGGIGHGPPSSAGSRGWLRCRVQGRLISQRVRRIVTYRRVHNTSFVAQNRVRGRRAPCRGAHGGARGGQGHK